MARVRVMIVDDSAVMVRLLKDIVSEDPRIDVVATASNGEEAVEKALEHKPQVIILDLEMPILNGPETIRELSRRNMDVAVLVISAYAKKGNAMLEEALAAGAFDFVLKPDNPLEIEKYARQITTQLFIASFSKTKQIPKAEDQHQGDGEETAEARPRNVTVVGCSTGGKQSLNQILPHLPDDYKGIFVAVIHLPPFVVKQYIREAGKECKVPVREVKDSLEVVRGHVYIAPAGTQDLVVEKSADGSRKLFSYLPPKPADEMESKPPTPSIDTLMESACRAWGDDIQGILLSGTGKDGVKGLRQIQIAGGLTIVEDRSSAMVPQLPAAAIDFGCVDKVLHAKEIRRFVHGC